MKVIAQTICEELGVKVQQVTAAIELLDEGATVPFISRYRKEVTGGLDDAQMRTLEERLQYLRELDERRESILKSIDEQNKLTPQLSAAIKAAATKTVLEDLYLPYKQKRRTKGQIAIEAGLEPLAELLLSNPNAAPEKEALAYFNAEAGFGDVKATLNGAKFILMERISEDAALIGDVRELLWNKADLSSLLVENTDKPVAKDMQEKFRDYFDFSEGLKRIPSHRALAMFRGRNEGVLTLKISLGDAEDAPQGHPCEQIIRRHSQIRDEGRAADKWLSEVVRWTWRVKLLPHMETDIFGTIRERSETEAIRVFADNLKDLLLMAPAGPKVTIGLDPGLRTGVKIAVVDGTGKVLDHTAIFPNAPQKRIQESEMVLKGLIEKHGAQLIAIGNGTASRETERFVADVIKNNSLKVQKVVVSEAGASIYSASEYASKEFPDLDVTIRGAISIARRLQDPLAELVKIEPKSIGVGQYQHDVSQIQLNRNLSAVVEDCVNAVGVDVNTASPALLNKVSGLNQTIADNIVNFRNENGPFNNRKSLNKVPRLGSKTYEQAAGFLRIVGGDNPLDSSAVHPEAYPVVENILASSKKKISSLIGDKTYLGQLNAREFTSEKFGLPTVQDIISELQKPGRDPRPEFKTATFQDGVETIKDLEPGMILEGCVTNVANFGAFIDIGVHQDGLAHISCLSHKFIKDPREAVRANDIVKVKVLEVDVARKRISLTLRLDDEIGASETNERANKGSGSHRQKQNKPNKEKAAQKPANGSFAGLFANAKSQRKDGRL